MQYCISPKLVDSINIKFEIKSKYKRKIHLQTTTFLLNIVPVPYDTIFFFVRLPVNVGSKPAAKEI